MAPKEFTVVNITNQKEKYTIDDNATVLDLAEMVAKRIDVSIDHFDLKVRNTSTNKFLSNQQYELIKDVEDLQKGEDILLILRKNIKKFVKKVEEKKVEETDIPCGGRRRKSKKTRKTKRSRRQTRSNRRR